MSLLSLNYVRIMKFDLKNYTAFYFTSEQELKGLVISTMLAKHSVTAGYILPGAD